MKNLSFSAAAAAALTALVGAPASAHSDARDASSGHYEWQSPAQFGPRAPLRAPVRKWVSNTPEKNEGVGGSYCDPSNIGKPGHYEWRSPPQYGPRAPLRPSVRVWVEC